MKSLRRIFAVTFAVVLMALPAAAVEKFRAASERGVPDTYTVVLATGAARGPFDKDSKLPAVREVAVSLSRAYGGQLGQVWEHALQGFLVRMPESRARKLARDKRVVSVEQDFWVPSNLSANAAVDCYQNDTHGEDSHASLPSNILPQLINCTDPSPDTGGTPCVDNWGLDRIDQPGPNRNGAYFFTDNGRNETTTVHVYVFDVGVRGTHREFQDVYGLTRVQSGADVSEDENPVPGPGTPPDCANCTPPNCTPTVPEHYAHGTHVAGIIAGRTYGVAKDVIVHSLNYAPCPFRLIAQEVNSGAIDGFEWLVQQVTTQRNQNPGEPWPAVVNWSGGNGTATETNNGVRTAVQGLLNNRIILVQSAGNQDADVDACVRTFGARFPEVIVVGGIDDTDSRWSRDPAECTSECGSNRGSCVDIWAPASNIISASVLGDSQVCRLSGTSMAAPHVAGVVAFYLEHNPWATATEVERALRSGGSWTPIADAGDSDNVVLQSEAASMGSNLPPNASFTFSCVNRNCSFTTTGTTDDSLLSQITFMWGDGSPVENYPVGGASVSMTVPHTFPPTGTYRVTLRATDASGRTDHYSAMVPGDAPPIAKFQSDCFVQTCTFYGNYSSDDVGITELRWDFGDGSSAQGTSVSHAYDGSSNSFNVTLRVRDTTGQWATTLQTINLDVPQPSNLVATASGTTVDLQWAAVWGVDGYQVERKVDSGDWQLGPAVTGAATNSASDTPASNSGVVLYRVRAYYGSSMSEPTNNDVAFVGTFTGDPPLSGPPYTIVNAAHIIEMRKAVNGLLNIAELSSVYSGSALDENSLRGQKIENEHFIDLMTRLNSARTAAITALPSASFTSPPASGGSIEPNHITELRNGVR